MQDVQQRKNEDNDGPAILEHLQKYASFETIGIVLSYLFIGYYVDPSDICITQTHVPYLILLLSVITLFHGFESGLLAMGIIAGAMWFFYASFPYVDFLVAVMMTLMLSQFHYFWHRQILEAQVVSEYSASKLEELAKAFYSLKISHDQLEKNYVLKPMSLRNSLVIIKEASNQEENLLNDFLRLLEKNFRVAQVGIATKEEVFKLTADQNLKIKEINFDDLLIEKVLMRKKAIFISDDINKKSDYIAVIPALEHDEVIGLLLIEKMPFMSFNKENLISISILFEYFFHEVRKEEILKTMTILPLIEEENFRFEFYRMQHNYKEHKINSTNLVLKSSNELLMDRLFASIKKILRSLDMVTRIQKNDIFYIVLLFPFANESASYGFISRLLSGFDDIQRDSFESMSFDFSKIELLEEYLSLKNG